MNQGLWERVQAALPTLAQAGAAQRAPLHWQHLLGLSARWPQAHPRVQQHLGPHLARALESLQGQLAQPRPSAAHIPRWPPAGWPAAQASPAHLRSAAAMQALLARLRLAEQVQHALVAPPRSAGPMHAQVLVQRSLQWMQTLSPAYVQHFMQQLDALQALEDGQRRPTATKTLAKPTGKASARPDKG